MDCTRSMATLYELVRRLNYGLFLLFLIILTLGPNELSFRNVDAVSPLMGYFGLPKGPRTVIFTCLVKHRS